MLFHDPADVTMSDQPLGSGGFGSVYAGKVTKKVTFLSRIAHTLKQSGSQFDVRVTQEIAIHVCDAMAYKTS